MGDERHVGAVGGASECDGGLREQLSRGGALARSKVARTLRVVVTLLAIALWVAWQAETTVRVCCVGFAGMPTDGTFQLFNPLRRIDAGQAAGTEFVFFHGVVIPYLHFPFYKAFGSTVFAAEAARNLVSPLLFLLSTFLFSRAIARTFEHALLLTAAALAASFSFGAVADLALAGNSLLGVRSTAPVLFAALITAGASFGESRRARVGDGAWQGAALAVAVLAGTEHGLALAMAAVVVQLLVKRARPPAEHAWFFGGLLGGGVVVTTTLLFLVAHGSSSGVRQIVRYNFVDVPADQFWYFGVPPNRYLSSWSDVFVDPVLPLQLLLGAALLLVVRWAWRQFPRERDKLAGVAVLLVYGVLSTISFFGYTNSGALTPLARSLLLATLALGYVVVTNVRVSATLLRGDRPLGGIAALVHLLALVAIVLSFLPRGVFAAAAALEAHVSRLSRDGPTLGAGWSGYLDSMHVVPDGPCVSDGRPLVWSTYAGLLESERGCFHSSADSIIHALGDARRRAYVEGFVRTEPQFAQTMRRTRFLYEQWLQAENWDFYEALIAAYEPIALTGHSILWERRPPGAREVVVGNRRSAAILGADRAVIALPRSTARRTVVVVEVEVDVDNPFRLLPIVGIMPRYLVKFDGTLNTTPTSIDPDRRVVRFPVFPAPGAATATLRFETDSLLPFVSWRARRLEYWPLHLPDTREWRYFLDA